MNAVRFGNGGYVESLLHSPLVKYDTIATVVQTGDLLFASGRGLISRLISWGTGSPWSHVGMVLTNTSDSRVLLIEAPATDTLRIMDLRDYAVPGSQPGSESRHVDPYYGQLVLARPLAFVSDGYSGHPDQHDVDDLQNRIRQRVCQGFPADYDWWEILRIILLLIGGFRWRVWRKGHVEGRRRMHNAELERILQVNGATDSLRFPTPQRTRKLVVTTQSRARKMLGQNAYTCSELVAALLSLHGPYASVFSNGLAGDGFITPGDLAEQIPHVIIARIRA